jgi:hypothetical protein
MHITAIFGPNILIFSSLLDVRFTSGFWFHGSAKMLVLVISILAAAAAVRFFF